MIRLFKVNVSLQGRKEGEILSLKCDRNGTIIDGFWRNRFEDSKIDNCITEIAVEKKKNNKDKAGNK